MSKMILNIAAALFSALMLCNCVEDESTIGDTTTVNDNTYSPLAMKSATTKSSQLLRQRSQSSYRNGLQQFYG